MYSGRVAWLECSLALLMGRVLVSWTKTYDHALTTPMQVLVLAQVYCHVFDCLEGCISHFQANLVSLVAWPYRYADTCSAVVVATASGTVQTFVVAGEVTPTWAQQSPACITQGRHLVAIRSEVLHGCLCMSPHACV